MKRFDDDRLKEIYETRFASGVPEHVSVAAHELARPLMAACSLQDVGVLGTIVRWSQEPERFGLQVDGKRHVTFAWSEEIGAHEMRLERG